MRNKRLTCRFLSTVLTALNLPERTSTQLFSYFQYKEVMDSLWEESFWPGADAIQFLGYVPNYTVLHTWTPYTACSVSGETKSHKFVWVYKCIWVSLTLQYFLTLSRQYMVKSTNSEASHYAIYPISPIPLFSHRCTCTWFSRYEMVIYKRHVHTSSREVETCFFPDKEVCALQRLST
jgi:hypothetical protein